MLPNKSLDASGGGVFLNLFGAAKGALNRAAASTQPLGGIAILFDKISSTLRASKLASLMRAEENQVAWLNQRATQQFVAGEPRVASLSTNVVRRRLCVT